MDEGTILYIYVPEGTKVCRCSGRIYDRNHESDIDITNNEELVYKLYARKQDSYFVNKIYPAFDMRDMREDLIERAKKMTQIRSTKHPWISMSNEEMLKSAGLMLKNPETREEGITLAGILLFGKDNTIMSVLPQHKTDAIFRVKDLDRYDDRDVIITNLIESYDRLMEFGKKHLNDPFILEGIQSVSARDAILREIISNLLAHRDFSSGYIAKFVIGKEELYTENSNRSHGFGSLNLQSFQPFPKNPAISKVFREIGLADELGSGMRNTYKYTKLYSGGMPLFEEGDVFKTIIPLNTVANTKVGPDMQVIVSDVHDSVHDTSHVIMHEKAQIILELCSVPRKRAELQEYLEIASRSYFQENILNPLLEKGLIVMTIPDKPKSRNQQYIVGVEVRKNNGDL